MCVPSGRIFNARLPKKCKDFAVLVGRGQVARAKERQMQTDLNILEAKAGNEMKDSMKLRQLQRDADANRTLYESFLGRFKQTSEQQEMQLSDTRVIARAETPPNASFPQRWLFLMLGAFAGGVLGAGLSYLVDFLDRGYRTAPQLEEGYGACPLSVRCLA